MNKEKIKYNLLENSLIREVPKSIQKEEQHLFLKSKSNNKRLNNSKSRPLLKDI